MKRVLSSAVRVVDGILALGVSLFLFAPGVLFLLVTSRRGARRPARLSQTDAQRKSRKLLCLVPTDLDSLRKKGTAWMILDRDEQGYFDHVYSIHFLFHSPRSQTVALNERLTVIESGLAGFALRRLGLFYTPIALSFLPFVSRLAELIEQNAISIIRAHDTYLMGVFGILLERITGVPCVVSIHADYDKRTAIARDSIRMTRPLGWRGVGKLIERFVLTNARMVMPIRESLGKWAIARGAKPNRIRVIPHGIPVDAFLRPADPRVKEEFGLGEKQFVLFAGRLSQENYVEDCLRAAQLTLQRIPDLHFLFVGDGLEREHLLALSRQLGIQDRVQLPGFQSWERVVALRLNADVNLCLMGGFSLIEAAFSGKPTISYDVEWHSELIKNDETGCLIREGDVEGVANAIAQLLENESLAKKLGENARRLALERHSIETASRIRVQGYEELLQSAGKVKSVEERVQEGNSWYVRDQFIAGEQPGYRLVNRDRNRYFREAIQRKASGNFLLFEAGCGDGFVLKQFEALPGARLVGMDYNQLRLERAHKHLPAAQFIAGDLAAIGLEENSLEVILCNQVLEHIPDDRAVLMELYRLLKPGGLCIVCVPNEGCLMGRMRNRILEPYIPRLTDHVNFYTEAKFRQVIAGTSFRLVRVGHLGFFTPHQFLHKLLNRFEPVHAGMNVLGEKIFPSQTGSLVFELLKENSALGTWGV